jgi:hypothetical protein
MNVALITAREYLEAERKASCNGKDTAAFVRIKAELKQLPSVQERLSLEFLSMAWDALHRNNDPGRLAVLGICYTCAASGQQLPNHTALIEKIVTRCFELTGKEQNRQLALTAELGLTSLRTLNPMRFRFVVDALRQRCARPSLAAQSEILSRATETPTEKTRRLADLKKRVRSHRVEKEDSVRSNWN